MSLLNSYFLLQDQGRQLLNSSYDPILVGLSITVAVFASYTTLSLTRQMLNEYAEGSKSAPYWWLGSAFTFGAGVFSMHFIGMLAFSIPVSVRYDLGMTLLSLLAVILVSAFAFHQLKQNTLHWPRVAAGGALLGLGIGVMHYTGMAGRQLLQRRELWH